MNYKVLTKIFSLIVCLGILVLLTGCNSNTENNAQTVTVMTDSGESKKTTRLLDNEKKVQKILKSYTYGEQIAKPDIVVGDRYFDTQITDYYKNFQLYEGKSVEIEGFYLTDDLYTFVGRYSISNLCQDCPAGYSTFEFEWHGDEELNLENETEWLKVRGVFKRGEDETGEYYYIEARSIQVMQEWGLDTVSN